LERVSSAASGSAREARRGGLAVALVVGVALALRLPGHLGSGLWYDEIWMLVDLGRAPLGVVVGSFPGDHHHPLYSLLGWLSLRASGESAWAWRLPAVVFGALSVGMLLVYARRVTGASEAWLATALLATSYHHVWFSQNARGYTMLLFFTLAATWLYEELAAGRGGRARVAGYALTLALGIYAHLTAAVVAVAQLAVSAIRRLATLRRGSGAPVSWRLPLAGVGLAALLALLAYAPMAGEMASFFWHKTAKSLALAGELGAPRASAWTTVWWTVEATAMSLGLGLAAGLAALVAGAAVMAAGALDYAREAPWRLAVWTLPGALLALALVALGRSLWPRFFFFLAGFALLVLARGWLALARALAPRRLAGRRLDGLAGAALWIAWTALLPRAYALPKQDFEGAREFLSANRRQGEVVATIGMATLPYRDYYPTDYVGVRSVAELAALEREATGVYVVSTIPEFLRSRRPELAAELAARGREIARFRGSVGDGDVVVLRLAPAAAGERTP
jgi:mannosyltransferase